MNRIFPILLLLTFSFSSFSQSENRENRQQKRKAQLQEYIQARNAFISKEAQLSEKEAADFFPLYEALQSQKVTLNRNLREEFHKIQNAAAVTDETYLSVVARIDSLPLKEAELTQEYTQKFKKILSPEKLYRVKLAERRFTRQSLAPRIGNEKKNLQKQ